MPISGSLPIAMSVLDVALVCGAVDVVVQVVLGYAESDVDKCLEALGNLFFWREFLLLPHDASSVAGVLTLYTQR